MGYKSLLGNPDHKVLNGKCFSLQFCRPDARIADWYGLTSHVDRIGKADVLITQTKNMTSI